MKKQFMKTTALVAAALIGGAGSAALAQDKMQANKPMLSLGGYYEGDIGFPINNVSGAPKHSAIDYHAESEVHFNGSVKLDNGVSIRVRWELEGDSDGSPAPNSKEHVHSEDLDDDSSTPETANALEPVAVSSSVGRDPIDEVYVTVQGAFGQLMLGSTDNAVVKMHTGYSGSWATGVAQNHTFDAWEWTATIPAAFATTRDSRATSFDGDAEKISYFTPRMSGVQLGVSYTPNTREQDTNDASAMADAVDTYHNGIAVGANWTSKFDMASVAVAGGYVSAEAPKRGDKKDPALWVAAVKVATGPVTVAAGYKAITEGSMQPQGRLFDVGVKYSMGPNRWSLTYSRGKEKETKYFSQAAVLGFAHTLGAGTRWQANLIYNKAKAENPDDVVVSGSGWALSTGFKIAF